MPWLRAMAGAGLPAVLLREPQRSADQLRELRDTAERLGLHVVIHTKHPMAEGVVGPKGALHQPGDASLAPSHPHWSRSCHTQAEVRRALDQGARWVLYSPVWRPTSKPTDPRPALGPACFLHTAKAQPVLALGGITPDRAAQLLGAGARGVAVLGDLFGRDSPEEAAQQVLRYREAVVSLPRSLSSNRNSSS